ncbi:MAG: type II CAAX endopeptidase family protein [Rubritalea sp.]|uniref:CPBP family intramembrane glutamic endopeptidase n=1 Tax=Rubritalea sp. TaxID=2109375 RepID=UPI003242A264
MNLLALSQGEFGHTILQDIALICVIGTLIAGLIHGWLRKASPNLQWHKIGNVSTEALGSADILGCLLVSLPFSLSLISPYQDPSDNDLSSILLIANFAILSLMAGIVLAIFQKRGLLPDALGLHPKHPMQVISWSIAAYIFFFILSIAMSQLGLEEWLSSRLGEQQRQQIVNEMMATQENQKRLIMILGACVIAPIAEEIVFRGYLYPVVKRYTEPVIAAIFTGVIFGAIHGQIWAVIPLSLFGILLAVLYEKSGSIWACILCHAMFNTINVFFMLTMGDQL